MGHVTLYTYIWKEFYMNLALVDDMPLEIERIRFFLQKYAAANGLQLDIDCFSSAEELLSGYHPFQYTAIFMDIYLEGMSGVAAAGEIRAMDHDVLLIFLTSSAEHMPDAFRYHAYDYIQKPAEADRLFMVMDDILKKHADRVSALSFSSDRTHYCIPCSDIAALRSVDHYLEILDKNNVVYKTRMTFSSAASLLSEDSRFLLILRGVLVNMDYILSLEDGICHLPHNRLLPVNVRNRKKIEQTWKNYIFAKDRSMT